MIRTFGSEFEDIGAEHELQHQPGQRSGVFGLNLCLERHHTLLQLRCKTRRLQVLCARIHRLHAKTQRWDAGLEKLRMSVQDGQASDLAPVMARDLKERYLTLALENQKHKMKLQFLSRIEHAIKEAVATLKQRYETLDRIISSTSSSSQGAGS